MDSEDVLEIQHRFNTELHTLVESTVRTCRSAGVDINIAITLVFIPLICEAAAATQASGMEWNKFSELCKLVYETVHERPDDKILQ